MKKELFQRKILLSFFLRNLRESAKKSNQRCNEENEGTIFFTVHIANISKTNTWMLYRAHTKSSNEAQTKQIYDFCSLLIAYYSFAKHLMLLSSIGFTFFICPIYSFNAFFSLQLTLGICSMRLSRSVVYGLLSYDSN